MSKIYKTARGKTLDMDKIKLSNETVTAVGNMKVNARGDKLGAGGKVIAGRNQVMDKIYSVESAGNGGYSPNDPATFAARKAEAEAGRAKQLHDLATNLIQTGSIESAAPVQSADKPATRGSLASSVAKTAVVVQEPLPNPKTSKGPTRI